MSSSKFSSFIYPIIFFLHLQTVYGSFDVSCWGTPTNLNNGKDPYLQSVHKILSYLSLKTPKGFAMASFGSALNRTYGLSLCYGIVSPTDCATCVSEASTTALQECKQFRNVAVVLDDCILKYSDSIFFGEIDNDAFICSESIPRNGSKPKSVSKEATTLIQTLAQVASEKSTLYATGVWPVPPENIKLRLYGSAQCSRDLSGEDCKECLDVPVHRIAGCGKHGGRVVTVSCDVRYEIYKLKFDN